MIEIMILLTAIYFIGFAVAFVLIYTVDVVDESDISLRLSKKFIALKAMLSWIMVLITILYLIYRALKSLFLSLRS